jgi:hypothetical protein
MASAGVIAVIEGPGVGRGMEDLIGVEILGVEGGGAEECGGKRKMAFTGPGVPVRNHGKQIH